jgi:uncharacterized protein involved in response to NO
MENKRRDPYSYMFPLGILSAGLGILLWLGFAAQIVHFFPRNAHGNLMFFGFLWAFVAGFLMTAIPKMTQTQPAQAWEILSAVVLVLCQWVLNIFNWVDLAVWIYGLQIVFLMIFICQRFLKRRKLPFEGFIFLPFALVSALAGVFVTIYAKEQGLGFLYLYSGQAFVLNLICGLGSRLIPALTRIPAALNPDERSQSSNLIEMIFLAVLLNSTFWLESLQLSSVGWSMRAVVLMAIAVRNFKILRQPASRSYVGWGLRLSVLTMISCYFILSFGVANPLAVLHLVFIAGLGLITLMVATRVTLAHGGESLDTELSSKALAAVVSLFLIAGIVRSTAGTEYTGVMMIAAAFLFLLAISIWFVRFYRLLVKV